MPSVPYSPVPDVAAQDIPSPFLRVQVDPNAFGAGIARAVQGLGGTLEKSGNELFDRAVAMQQLRNETEATEKAADYVQASDRLFTDYESQKRGINAVNGEEDHRKAQRELWEQSSNGLSNPMAQKMFNSKTFGDFNRVLFYGARHAAAEGRTATSNSYQSEVRAAQDVAGNARSVDELEQRLNTIDSTTSDFANANGLSSASRDQLAFKDKSTARANFIEGLALRDPPAAKKLMDEWIGQGLFHGNDRNNVEAKVHSQLMSTGASTIVNQNEQDFRNPEGWIARRGNVRATGIDQQFGQNLVAAGTAYERETGKSVHIESLVRTTAEQARIRAEHEAMPGGVEAHPAAQPGTSRHEFGRAADVDPDFANWLRQGNNAQKYGVEFLPGKTGVNDPNHIQLAGDAPLRRVRTYDINERDYVEGAVGRLQAQLPNAPPEMVDRVRGQATALYHKNADYDRQEELGYRNTILEAFDQDNPPRTPEDLFRMGNKYQEAWNQLDQKDQDAFIKRFKTQRVATDNTEWQRLRGMALSQDEDERQKFLKEDIVGNTKLSSGSQREIMRLQDTVRKQAFVEPRVAHAEAELLDAGIITQDDAKDKNLMARLRGTLWDRIDQYQKVREAYPKPEEIRQMGARIMAEMPSDVKFTHDFIPGAGFRTLGNFLGFGRPGRLIDVAVPTRASDEIIDQWSSSHGGIPPTDEQVKRIYIGQQYQELYGKSKSK